MRQPRGRWDGDDPPPPPEVWPTEDRGSFTHGVCRSCSWVGPARRARSSAATDAELHALGCEVADAIVEPPVDELALAPQATDVASGRERLTARGRS